MAFDDRHASFADLAVPAPRIDGAGARGRAFITLLHSRVYLGPWRPCFPFVKIVDLAEDHGGWCIDRRRSLDVIVRRLQRDNANKYHNDNYDDDETAKQNFLDPWESLSLVDRLASADILPELLSNRPNREFQLLLRNSLLAMLGFFYPRLDEFLYQRCR